MYRQSFIFLYLTCGGPSSWRLHSRWLKLLLHVDISPTYRRLLTRVVGTLVPIDMLGVGGMYSLQKVILQLRHASGHYPANTTFFRYIYATKTSLILTIWLMIYIIASPFLPPSSQWVTSFMIVPSQAIIQKFRLLSRHNSGS